MAHGDQAPPGSLLSPWDVLEVPLERHANLGSEAALALGSSSLEPVAKLSVDDDGHGRPALFPRY